jgi:hypothetical protein
MISERIPCVTSIPWCDHTTPCLSPSPSPRPRPYLRLSARRRRRPPRSCRRRRWPRASGGRRRAAWPGGPKWFPRHQGPLRRTNRTGSAGDRPQHSARAGGGRGGRRQRRSCSSFQRPPVLASACPGAVGESSWESEGGPSRLCGLHGPPLPSMPFQAVIGALLRGELLRRGAD